MATSIAMFLRNLVILAIFAPTSVGVALLPLGSMTLAAIVTVWIYRNWAATPPPQLKLASPVSLPHVLEFAAIFVLLSATGTLTQRYFGGLSFLAVSIFRGLVSSASTTATAAALVAGGKITPQTAGIAVVLTSMASVFVDMPIVSRQIREPSVSRRLIIASAMVIGLGLSLMGFARFFHQDIDRIAAATGHSLQQIADTTKAGTVGQYRNSAEDAGIVHR